MGFYCSNAFNNLDVCRNGFVHLCCGGWTPKPLGNVLEKNLVDMWQGAMVRDIRERIYRGDFSTCSGCLNLPAPHGPIVLSSTPPMLEVPRIPRLQLGYDYVCNLRCATCRTSFHTPSESVKQMVRSISSRIIASGALAYVDKLCFMGSGDPWASPFVREFWEAVPWTIYPDLKLILHTNAILFTEDCWKTMMPEARKRVCKVLVSLDSASFETYKINRLGNSEGLLLQAQKVYDTLRENLNFIAQLRRSGTIEKLRWCFVVQDNNFSEMKSFVEQAWKHSVDEIIFQKINNWTVFTNVEYNKRAVHLPEHPNNDKFLKMLKHPCFNDSRILMHDFSGSHIGGGCK